MPDRQPGESVDILLVEDNPGDVRLTQEAFNEAAFATEIHTVTDGEDALDFLHRRGDYQSAVTHYLVLLDLNLPRLDGLEVLERIKSNSKLKLIPVIVLTSSTAEVDIVRSYELHTNAYLTKPIDPDRFTELARTLETFWFEQARLPPVEAR